MLEPIQISIRTTPTPYSQQLQETSLRRQLFAELATIGDKLLQSNTQDETSQAIIKWHTSFKKSLLLKNVEEQKVLDEYIQLLQEILIDRLLFVPLDEDAVLGNDGHTYNSKSLYIYLINAPEEYKAKSPLHPTSSEVFTTVPHLIVKDMIQWLKARNAFLQSDEVEQEFQEILEQTKKPIITVIPSSDPRTQQRQRIVQKQAERELKRKIFQEELEAFRLESLQKANEAFAPIHKNIENITKVALEKLDSIQQDFKQQLQSVKYMELGLEKEIEELERANRELNYSLAKIQVGIDSLEKDGMLLQRSINETRIMINKRRKSSFKDFGLAILSIGACAFSTWALQSVISGMGSSISGAVLPSSKGIGVSIKIPL